MHRIAVTIPTAILIMLLVIPALPLFGNTESAESLRGNDLKIHLLTVGPGDPVYLWYGHTALIVEDALNDVEILYDYGVFDFRQDNFFRNFAMGRLIYSITASYARYRIQSAIDTNRTVITATLNLPPEVRYEMALFLQENVQPGNNTYLYHHYLDNCATRIRDIIDTAVNGELKEWAEAQPGRMSYREHIRRYSDSNYLMDWLLNFLQSGSIDNPISRWDDMFLPDELLKALSDFSYEDETGKLVPLLTATEQIYTAVGRVEPYRETRSFWPYALLASTLLGAILLLLLYLFLHRQSRLAGRIYGAITAITALITGTLSIGLLLMMTLTNHEVTYRNENILVLSPLMLAVGIIGCIMLFNSTRQMRMLQVQFILMRIQAAAALAYLACKGIFPGFLDQQNWLTVAITLPALTIMVIVSLLPTVKSALLSASSQERSVSHPLR